MSAGTPCYCPNHYCQERENFYGFGKSHCKRCGTSLIIQPQKILLGKPLYGVFEAGNCEVFEIIDLSFSPATYPKIVKILRPNTSAIALELFQQEANLLATLKGLAVPRVEPQAYFNFSMEYGQQQQTLHCLMMEKIEGQTLEQYVKTNGTINLEVAIDWLRQIAQLLLDIHWQNRIIHRDIKPSNIMVVEKENFPYGQLILIDFGAARRNTPTYIQKLLQSHPLTKVISGGYTAPEQVAGKCIFKSDLYSLGQTFIYLLTGYSPEELAENQKNWQHLITSTAIRRLLIELTKQDHHQRLANSSILLDKIAKLLQYPTPLSRQLFALWYHPLFKKAAIACVSLTATIASFNGLNPVVAEQFFDRAEKIYANNPAEAQKLYNLTLALNSTHGGANFGKAYLCDENKDFTCAKKHYLMASENSPNHESVSYFFAVSNYARIQIQTLQDLDQAIQSLKQILPISQKYRREGSIYKNLGWAYLVKLDFDAAELYFNQASKTLDNNPELLCLQQALEKARATNNLPAVAQCADANNQLAKN